MRILLGAIATLAMVSAAEAACPDFTQAPAFSETTLAAGFTPDPFSVDILSGGEVDLSTCNLFSGTGWVATAPDYRITYNTSGSTTLTFTIVPSDSTDTVLLVNGPDGTWYFDDDSGFALMPEIQFPNAQSGIYDIWIGNFSAGANIDTRLWVTERD